MSEIREGPSGRTGSAVSEERGFAGVGESSHATRDRRRGRAGRTKFVVLTEKRKPERRDRTAAPRPEATPPAMRHRTATQPFGAKKMQLRQSKCSTYDDVAFTLPIVAFALSGDPKNAIGNRDYAPSSVERVCPASASISGCVQRLSYACKPSLLTHGTPRPSARSFPDSGRALAIRPLNCVYCTSGPRDSSSPYPWRTSRLGRSKCDWVRSRGCRKDLTSFQCRRASA